LPSPSPPPTDGGGVALPSPSPPPTDGGDVALPSATPADGSHAQKISPSPSPSPLPHECKNQAELGPVVASSEPSATSRQVYPPGCDWQVWLDAFYFGIPEGTSDPERSYPGCSVDGWF
ncbi:MAG: hypothetical protein M1826_005718, partial [Phylliscum demangeonii]